MRRGMKSLLFLGVIAMGSMVFGLTSCSSDKYDDSELRALIDKNAKDIASIRELINSGLSITSVTKITEGTGGIRITLSNGTSYDIVNGANGANGANGTNAAVWTIGSDSLWYKDGLKTGYRAIGEKGATGNYYRPDTATASPSYGKFLLCNGSTDVVIKATDISWLATGVTAVVQNNVLMLSNVEVDNVKGKQISIPLARAVSLSIDIEENSDVRYGYPVVYFVNDTATVRYRVYPANAVVNVDKDTVYVRTNNVSTRGFGAFTAKGKIMSYSGGILTVKITGENFSDCSESKKDIFYIELGDSTATRQIVSDYAIASVGHYKFVDAVIGGFTKQVKAIQLWKDGPYWAEFNVGATIGSYSEVDNDKWSNAISDISSDPTNPTLVDTSDSKQKFLFSYVGNYFNWGKTVQHVPANKSHRCGVMFDISGWIDSKSADTIGDAATANWGRSWCMPNKDEFCILSNHNGISAKDYGKVENYWCDGGKDRGNGKKFKGSSIPGICFKGKDDYAGDSIFFPATGNCYNGNIYSVGLHGCYWSSVPVSDNFAWHLVFISDNAGMNSTDRGSGRSVRAVCAK